MENQGSKARTNQIPREVIKPIDLIGYQQGAVVSRAVMSNKGGTITLFSFDTEQQLSEHTAPFDAFVQVLEGEVDITISGRKHRLSGGESIIMPANEPHALASVTRFKMLLSMIKS